MNKGYKLIPEIEAYSSEKNIYTFPMDINKMTLSDRIDFLLESEKIKIKIEGILTELEAVKQVFKEKGCISGTYNGYKYVQLPNKDFYRESIGKDTIGNFNLFIKLEGEGRLLVDKWKFNDNPDSVIDIKSPMYNGGNVNDQGIVSISDMSKRKTYQALPNGSIETIDWSNNPKKYQKTSDDVIKLLQIGVK